MKKKILILSPHADDEILGCGGFIQNIPKKLSYKCFNFNKYQIKELRNFFLSKY